LKFGAGFLVYRLALKKISKQFAGRIIINTFDNIFQKITMTNLHYQLDIFQACDCFVITTKNLQNLDHECYKKILNSMENCKLVYRFSHPFITNGRVQAEENNKVGKWEKNSLVIVLDHDCIQKLDNTIEKLNKLIGNEFTVESYVNYNQNVQNRYFNKTQKNVLLNAVFLKLTLMENCQKKSCAPVFQTILMTH